MRYCNGNINECVINVSIASVSKLPELTALDTGHGTATLNDLKIIFRDLIE